MKRLVMAAVMRVKPARGGSHVGGRDPPISSARRWGTIARRSALLLGGTAAIALSIAQPAGAISINDQVAAAAGGIFAAIERLSHHGQAATPGDHAPHRHS